jgi:hypothetical protein
MAHPSKLTPDQWAAAQVRWESEDREGYDWLAIEIAAAFGVTLSRQAVGKNACRNGWKKLPGSERSQLLAKVAQPSAGVEPGVAHEAFDSEAFGAAMGRPAGPVAVITWYIGEDGPPVPDAEVGPRPHRFRRVGLVIVGGLVVVLVLAAIVFSAG